VFCLKLLVAEETIAALSPSLAVSSSSSSAIHRARVLRGTCRILAASLTSPSACLMASINLFLLGFFRIIDLVS